MRLTAIDLEIIKGVSDGTIFDLFSFLVQLGGLKEATYTGTMTYMFAERALQTGDKVLVVEDEKKLISKLTEFIVFYRRLERSGLVFLTTITRPDRSPALVLGTVVSGSDGEIKNATIAEKAMEVFLQNRTFRVVPSPEFNEFIENGYLTRDEKILQDEVGSRKAAERSTRVVAIASIVASVVTSAGTAIFNYFTYSTQRSVSISNLSEIKYPLPVMVISQPTATNASAPIVGAVQQRSDATKKESQALDVAPKR